MSLLSGVTNKVKLIFARNKLNAARKSEGSKADYLYETANKNFEAAAGDNKLKSEASYLWGFSLYHQGISKTDADAESLLTQACEKFAVAVECGESSIKPAIDWGVALMALARLRNADGNDPLYDEALEKFRLAEELIFGSASYNLACIYAIRGDEEACKQSLEDARDNASLPKKKEVLDDADLNNVKESKWFTAFAETILKPPPQRKTRKQLAEEARAEKARIAAESASKSEPESENLETDPDS